MEPLASATAEVDGERDLADELLARIEERESEVRERLEQLITQRAATSRGERGAVRDALRAEAMTVRGELRRLQLLAAVAEALLLPASLRPGSRPTRESAGR